MIQKNALRQEIDTALAAPNTADPLLAAKRQMGLRFLIDARPGQTLADVTRVFQGLDDRFTVEPLFPSPPFDPPDPAAGDTWHQRAFVAAIGNVAFDDVTANPWDIAHAARTEGGFVTVVPEVPHPAPQPPVAAAADTEAYPGPGWEHVTMRITEAWQAIRARHPDRKFPLGNNVIIGHPDTGWTAHPVWGRGTPNLDIARSYNFLPGEPAHDATDRLVGGIMQMPGHGTATASVMLAPVGGPVVGVAPNAVVLPIRCITSVILYPLQTEVMRAIQYATQKKCRVISLSLGGFLDAASLSFLWLTVRQAVDANIIVVAAAGQYIPLRPTAFPAAFLESIAVAGLEGVGGVPDPRDGYKPWDQSSRGDPNLPGRITISAPAIPAYRAEVYGPGQYRYSNSEGTSYATAFMAGIAALWLSNHFIDGYSGAVSAQECFRRHVRQTAIRRPGFDPWFYGLVNAEALMTSTPSTAPLAAEAPAVVEYVPEAVAARMLGGEDAGAAARLLAAAVGGDAGALSGWSGEIGAILARQPTLCADLAKQLAASTLTADGLRSALAPFASEALRHRLTEAAAG